MIDKERKGTIFNIQKFSIHDGNGIRTLVFMKGCPLKCIWCSNPESQCFEREIMFVAKKCIRCGKCAAICPQSCVDQSTYVIDQEHCTMCGECVKTCYANAKKIVGKEMSIQDILEEVEKDWVFYHNSKGGITIGGGEPTSQPEFVLTLLEECKRLSLHTAIETCGYGSWDRIGGVLSAPDQLFYDLKHMDPERHKLLTGVDNHLILDNAQRVVDAVQDITFRIPLIPGCNDTEENIVNTGMFVKSLMSKNSEIKIELLPYHALGTDKYKWMGLEYQLGEIKEPPPQKVEKLKEILRELGCNG